jgi:GWxTD domain-containing protein
MKNLLKYIVLSILGILFSTHIYSKQVQAYYSISRFYLPNGEPYIETSFLIYGNSLILKKNSNQKYQGTVQITLKFKINDSIKSFLKYNLTSPETMDSTKLSMNFIDQQRISLPAGNYSFEFEIQDINSPTYILTYSDSLTIKPLKEKVTISDIKVISSFNESKEINNLSKNGYDLIPYIINYYPADVNKLSFYAEIYNTEKQFGKDELFLIKYYIESFEKSKIQQNYVIFKKESSKSVNILLSEFFIDNLASGNYNLVIEVRNKQNELIEDNRFFFQRNNPNIKYDINELNALNNTFLFTSKINNLDTIKDYINSLRPISTGLEKIFIDNQLNKMDINTMQKYLYNFWFTRNNLEPEKEWDKYKEKVIKVNSLYGTKIKKGYMTDRGRVYLQYGPPNTIDEMTHEPSSYPYEIWHYYTINNQTNRKFVFYNTDLVSNDYELLHSDAIGEIYRSNWQLILEGRNTPMDDIDQTKGYNHYGGKAEDFFNNPR